MPKKHKKNNTTPAIPPANSNVPETPSASAPSKTQLFAGWLSTFNIQAAIVGLLAFVIYANTFKHEFALDDTIVIVRNEYVTKGFAGIKDIMTKDAFDSYYRQSNSSNQLAGGRYRPLSIVSFAVEQQFMGVDTSMTHDIAAGDKHTPLEQRVLDRMHTRHVINVLFYALSCIVFLWFLRYIVFTANPVMALVAALLFTVHPIHTEVVANVKSRDEILSFLFICLTFIYAFKYVREQNKTALYISLGSYLMAFLSKEYAIATLALLPLSLSFFEKMSLSKIARTTAPYLAVVVIYILLRLQVVAPANPDSEADILNNPYALATPAEQLATKIGTTLNYLKLLLWPNPLSADYSYNSIPYKDMGNPWVLLSLAVHGAMIYGFFYFRKRNQLLSFAIAVYILHLLLVCNLIFNIGGTMGERLIYHSSAGFAIFVAWLLVSGMEKLGSTAARTGALVGCLAVVIGLCSYKTIDRNQYWKNSDTLFTEDIKVVPNSAMVNANVGFSYLSRADNEKDSVKKMDFVRKSLPYYSKAIEIHPTYVASYVNRGLAYFQLGMSDSSKADFDRVWKYYPNYPGLHETYFNLGVQFYFHGRLQEAIDMWKYVVKVKPDFAQAQQSIVAAEAQLRAGQIPQAPPPPKK